jgi:hypothetical protein
MHNLKFDSKYNFENFKIDMRDFLQELQNERGPSFLDLIAKDFAEGQYVPGEERM